MQKMFENALISGRVVKSNTFETERGSYKIEIVAYKKDLYFFKYKEDELVECLNLTDMQGEL